MQLKKKKKATKKIKNKKKRTKKIEKKEISEEIVFLRDNLNIILDEFEMNFNADKEEIFFKKMPKKKG